MKVPSRNFLFDFQKSSPSVSKKLKHFQKTFSNTRVCPLKPFLLAKGQETLHYPKTKTKQSTTIEKNQNQNNDINSINHINDYNINLTNKTTTSKLTTFLKKKVINQK